MKIGNFDLDKEILVIAEVGNNHEGDFGIAQEMIKGAAQCGVDAVKFQTFNTEYYVSKSDIKRYERLKSFELSKSQFEKLSELTHSLGMLFISTPLDLESSIFLESLVDCYKIASGDNNFYPLIEQIAMTGKPIIMSTGVADLAQVNKSKKFICKVWQDRGLNRNLALLHCVSAYPVPPEQANLKAINALQNELDCIIGYSDHTLGTDASLLAVALGARIIEKHFTLDKDFSDFRDHKISADPNEMKELVCRIKQASLMLGKYGKIVQPCEEEVVVNMRRSIVSGSDLPEGHCIDLSDLMWTRPAGGLSPGEEGNLVGKRLKRAFLFGEVIHLSDVK